ncbi:MAG TPA: hypothetical protein PLA68_17860, partial [Panacibacter sp.]|nr:hypothetical protein [Panacibacter sp.]
MPAKKLYKHSFVYNLTHSCIKNIPTFYKHALFLRSIKNNSITFYFELKLKTNTTHYHISALHHAFIGVVALPNPYCPRPVRR